MPDAKPTDVTQTPDPRAESTRIRSAMTTLIQTTHHPSVALHLKNHVGGDFDKSDLALLKRVVASSEGQPRLGDLAERLGVEPSSISRKVAKLEQLGLVERHADPDDKRAQRLRVTKKGRTALDRSAECFEAIFSGATASWTSQERTAFTAQLERFAKNVAEQLGLTPTDPPEHPTTRHSPTKESH